MLRYGFNTNGFAHHKLEDCLVILADLGYAGVAITPDVCHLNPFTVTEQELTHVRELLATLGLQATIETGARFILDARNKHTPTLLDKDAKARDVRKDFLQRCIRIAAALEAKVVSFWSGKLSEGASKAQAQQYLIEGCQELLQFAKQHKIILAFEPEPGMLIENIAQFRQLRQAAGQDLQLALDVGHCYCTNDLPIAKIVNAMQHTIATAAIEDIRNAKHEHLMFGEGEIDFREVLQAFNKINYQGLLSVELSRDSHRAAEVAAKAIQFLKQMESTR